MIGGFDVAHTQRTCGGDDFGVEIVAAIERLRRRETRADDGGSVFDQIEPNQAGLLLENHRIAHRAPNTFALLRQNIRGADIGMPGERQFGARREDAHLRRVRTILRRQHEGSLGEVELAGDRLHLRAGQCRCVGNDRKRIAAEFAVGKDVDRDERDLHWRSLGMIKPHRCSVAFHDVSGTGLSSALFTNSTESIAAPS
jgi:hypothetical protein